MPQGCAKPRARITTRICGCSAESKSCDSPGSGLGGKAGEYLAAVKVKGDPEPKSTLCYIPIENSNNFSPLVDSIGRMFNHGTLDYPVERTLLTSGALSFLMESWHRGQVRIETPALNIRYKGPEQSYYAHGIGS